MKDLTNLVLKRKQVVIKQDRAGSQGIILRGYAVVGLVFAKSIRNGIP